MRTSQVRRYRWKSDARKAKNQFLRNHAGFPYDGRACIEWCELEDGSWGHALVTSQRGSD